MSEHISKWINAYYDGELQGRRLEQVEAHLAECEACQNELEALSGLSDWLQADASLTDLLPAGQFVSQVELLLPREQMKPSLRQRGWQLSITCLPIAVLVIGGLLQASIFANVLLFRLGVVQWQLIAGPAECVGRVLSQQPALYILRCGLSMVFSQSLMLALSLLYIGWLALWWAQQRHPNDLLIGLKSRIRTQN